MTVHPATTTVPAQLQEICGAAHVLTAEAQTRRYRKGYRCGDGPVLAVVLPGTLTQLWRVLAVCVAANVIMLMQAANTGLTGGSTPDGDYDRPVVLINTLRLAKIHLLDGGKQVVCLPGATLYQLEDALRPLGREPHSVIGSSCIGASVLGGVCNSSGGALIQRGPAYTELALFARVTASGKLDLVNHLGISLGSTPEEMLANLEAGNFDGAVRSGVGAASDTGYAQRVRDIEADTPARYNADPGRLHEASGCAGKLAVFAVRLDSFASTGPAHMFYIGSNSPQVLGELRRALLGSALPLPISAEYMEREAYDITEKYGKDTWLAVYHLGTKFLPRLFAAKSRFDAVAERVGLAGLSDHLLQLVAACFGRHLPKRVREYRAQYQHHLMVQVAAAERAPLQEFLSEFFSKAGRGSFFECTADEAKRAQLHRFAAASAAIRYQVIHKARLADDMVALDIALRRNDADWFEKLPADVADKIEAKLYYGHFFCHVLHQDYLIRKGHNHKAVKARMLALLDVRGAEYPAEHNVGHLYAAKPALKNFYHTLDPCNCFNPGIGKTSRRFNWS